MIKRDLSIGGYQAILAGDIQCALRASVGALEVKGMIGATLMLTSVVIRPFLR